MRLAVIDLGTNTFNLLIAEVMASGFRPVFNTKTAVKIGEGAMIQGKLLQEPMRRGKRALERYLGIIREHRCHCVQAFATSGIRSTSNGMDFITDVKSDLGLEVSVIDGDEEAQLIFEGVNLAVRLSDQPALIMDIGGGSTEFIIADLDGIKWKKSYRLGISRMLQKLEPSDPLRAEDVARLNRFFG